MKDEKIIKDMHKEAQSYFGSDEKSTFTNVKNTKNMI